ncbi:hypothetical protein PYCCODRAFT_1463777 [Trametes coccinea BRFM310]|uniref:Uncharacterized protein n=1 Tax=Trametes coccinea (strain BRFM310) TaxID=1353009 RepID=A0A1Y2J2B7_TRAC3|nr:hypothetical protein PYCCODRAFT_1463777 [Trametes coccinea BRFM310]
MSTYARSNSRATLYSQVARAVSVLSGTFSSVTAASGIGTCWAEVNPEGQPSSPPRVVKRCARLESEIIQLRKRLSTDVALLPIVQATDGGGLTCEFMFPASRSSSKSCTTSSSVTVVSDSIQHMKEEDITNVAQSLLYDCPQDETVFERPQVVDTKGVQVRVSGSMLDMNTSAIAASPSEDVTSTDLLFHIAEDVLVPLLPDKEYVREKVVPLKPKVSEDIKEDDTLAVTIAPIVVGGSMDQPGFEMQDCKYSEEEYAIATSDSTAAAAARVSEIIHEEYAPTKKLQATASAPSNKISVREVLDGSSRSQHLEIFSPQTDQHVTTDLLPPFVDNLIRGPSSNHTCSAPLVERSVVGFGPTLSMAGHEKLWSLSGTTLVSSVGYSASTGLPGSGWDQLLSDSLLIVPTSYIFGSLLSTADLFSSESWMVLVYRGSLSAGTRSVLPTPAQAYNLPNATTKELHANDLLLIQLGDHFISTVASAGNDSSSHNNLLDDPVMNSTPESCSDYAPVSVSLRRASSQVAAASQYLVQYQEEDFNRDDLLHKTIDNLISLLLGVLLCCLLSNPALCLLLIVFWLLFESTAGQPAASPAQVRSSGGPRGSNGLRDCALSLLSL